MALMKAAALVGQAMPGASQKEYRAFV